MWPIKNCQLWKRRTLLIYGKMKMGPGPLIHFRNGNSKLDFTFFTRQEYWRERKRETDREILIFADFLAFGEMNLSLRNEPAFKSCSQFGQCDQDYFGDFSGECNELAFLHRRNLLRLKLSTRQFKRFEACSSKIIPLFPSSRPRNSFLYLGDKNIILRIIEGFVIFRNVHLKRWGKSRERDISIKNANKNF